MDTVLGVSITSTGVGWVLADGSEDDDATLDHDAFDVDAVDTSQHAVAVRGAQVIAAATGHEIRSIGVTWTHDVDAEARQLLESLRESGYDNVVEVRLSQATKAWVQGIGRQLGYRTAAACVVEPAAVTLLTVDAVGAVQIDVTQSRDSATADGLSHWLSDVLNGDRREPDSLLLLGSRSDRDQLTGPLDEALPMPVIGTAEAQLVLARGAALALANHTIATNAVDTVVEEDEDPGENEPSPGPSWISSHARMMATLAAAVLVVVAVAFLALPRLLAQEYPSPKESPAGAAVSTPTRTAVSAPPATAYRIPLPTAPPPPVQPMVAEPPREAPIPTEAPQSLAVPVPEVAPVPEVEVIDDVPASPPIVEQAAVVSEPQAPQAPVLVPQEHAAAPPLAPGPEALPPPAPLPPPQAPVQSVLSPFFGALP